MELINVVSCVFLCIAVDGDTIPHLILHDEHTQLFELLSQLLNVKADKAVIQLHIRLVVEHPQRTIDVDFQCRGDALRLPFFLLPQAVVQITENRHIFRFRVIQIFLIDQRQASVNDGFFFRLHAVPCTHDKFTQGKDEVRLHAQRVIIVRIVQVNVHRVDVVPAGG